MLLEYPSITSGWISKWLQTASTSAFLSPSILIQVVRPLVLYLKQSEMPDNFFPPSIGIVIKYRNDNIFCFFPVRHHSGVRQYLFGTPGRKRLGRYRYFRYLSGRSFQDSCKKGRKRIERNKPGGTNQVILQIINHENKNYFNRTMPGADRNHIKRPACSCEIELSGWDKRWCPRPGAFQRRHMDWTEWQWRAAGMNMCPAIGARPNRYGLYGFPVTGNIQERLQMGARPLEIKFTGCISSA